MSQRSSTLWRELESHLPYSVFATASGIILAGILLYVAMVASSARPPGLRRRLLWKATSTRSVSTTTPSPSLRPQ